MVFTINLSQQNYLVKVLSCTTANLAKIYLSSSCPIVFILILILTMQDKCRLILQFKFSKITSNELLNVVMYSAKNSS